MFSRSFSAKYSLNTYYVQSIFLYIVFLCAIYEILLDLETRCVQNIQDVNGGVSEPERRVIYAVNAVKMVLAL